ncbi:hypothetical protein TNCV_1114611 [Trichonephila clavipes]|nr:hypothetical protein TNCV_1114611 [Trichonephila clavipes]
MELTDFSLRSTITESKSHSASWWSLPTFLFERQSQNFHISTPSSLTLAFSTSLVEEQSLNQLEGHSRRRSTSGKGVAEKPKFTSEPRDINDIR